MTTKRATKTVDRLIEIKRRSVDTAEAAYALARAATIEAEEVRLHAELAWLAAHEERDARPAIVFASDLESRDARVRHLRRVVDQTEVSVIAARKREAKDQEAVTKARTELRRFEIWVERQALLQEYERRRLTRIADDEFASRKRGVS